MDDRWVVVGVEHAPRGANGIIPTIMRIDVVDRQGGATRNVVESPPEDRTSGGKTIDSVALFGGKVYWITRDTFAGDAGKIQSYDLNTGTVSDVAVRRDAQRADHGGGPDVGRRVGSERRRQGRAEDSRCACRPRSPGRSAPAESR